MESLRSTKKMAVRNRIRGRKDRRLRLRVIRKNINKLGRAYLNGSDLKDAGVNRQIMSLEEKATLSRFFAPYNGKIDPPQDKEVLDYVNESFPRFDKLGIEHRAETAQRFLLSAHLTKWWYGDTTIRSTIRSTSKSTKNSTQKPTEKSTEKATEKTTVFNSLLTNYGLEVWSSGVRVLVLLKRYLVGSGWRFLEGNSGWLDSGF